MVRYKELYDSMSENGELKKLFPRMTGDWQKDKTFFIQEQQFLEDIIGNIDVDIEEE